MEFIKQHPKLVSVVSIAVIGMSVLANLLYFIFIPIEAQGDPEGFVETPILNQQVITRVPESTAPSPTTMIVLMILLAMVLLVIVIIFAALKYFEVKRKQRDKQRKADLKTLAQAFEAYKQIHGQYPLSSTFRPEYYTGVNLSNDWNYYGLPGKEHMANFIPNWPISDPSIDYMSRNQINQYLYYPKENGQKFYLYCHLESPSKNEEIDYNYQDNLLRSWGHYNYRVESGQEQPIEVNDEHKTPPPAPIQPQPQAPQPSIQEVPVTPTMTTMQPEQSPTTEVSTAPQAEQAPEPVSPMPTTNNQTLTQAAPAQPSLNNEVHAEPTSAPLIQPTESIQSQNPPIAELPQGEAPSTPEVPQAAVQDQGPEAPPTATLPLAGPVQNPPTQQSQNQDGSVGQEEEPRLITPDIN